MELSVRAAGPRPDSRPARARAAVLWLTTLWREPRRRGIAVALVAAAASAVAFARVTEDYLTNDPLARWDISFAHWLSTHRTPAGIDVFHAVTNFGSPAVSLLAATAVSIVLYRRRQLADAALLPVALAGAEVLNLALKVAFHRQRPEVGFVHLDTYSYPSGHAMIAAVTYGAFAHLYWRRASSHRRQVLMVSATTATVAMISFSRLYLGVHYLSDVLGALAAGATWLAISIAISLTYGERFAHWFADTPADRVGRHVTRT